MPRLAPVTKATGAGRVMDRDPLVRIARLGPRPTLQLTVPLRQRDHLRRLRAFQGSESDRGWVDAARGSGVRRDGSGIGHRARDQSPLRGGGRAHRRRRPAPGDGGRDRRPARGQGTFLVCRRRRERTVGGRDVRPSRRPFRPRRRARQQRRRRPRAGRRARSADEDGPADDPHERRGLHAPDGDQRERGLLLSARGGEADAAGQASGQHHQHVEHRRASRPTGT